MDDPPTIIKDTFSLLLWMLVETSLRLMVIPVWFGLIDTNKLKSMASEDIVNELNWSWTDIVGQFQRYEKATNSNKHSWITNYSTLWNTITFGIEICMMLIHTSLFIILSKAFVSISLLLEYQDLIVSCGMVIGVIFHTLTRYVHVTRLVYYVLLSPLINFTAMVCMAYLDNHFAVHSTSSTSATLSNGLHTDSTNENTKSTLRTLPPEVVAKCFQNLVTSYGSEATILLHSTIPSNQLLDRYQLLCFVLRWQYVEIWIRSETTMLVSRVSDAYKRFHPQEYEDCRNTKRTTFELSRKGFHNYGSYEWVNSKVPNIVELFETSQEGNLLPAINALDSAIQQYQASRPSWHILKKNAHKHFLTIIDNHIAGVLAIPFEEVKQMLKQFLVKPTS